MPFIPQRPLYGVCFNVTTATRSVEKKQTVFAMFLRIACAKTIFCFSVGMFVSSKQYNYIFVFIICQ